MILVCASPTCRRHLVINPSATIPVSAVLRFYGWRLEQQPGDDADAAYCSRCKT